MNKLNIYLSILLGMFITFSCDSDRDSNPELQTPVTFQLNTPPYAANAVYDLMNTETVELTTSQPDYGFTAATLYNVQISTSGEFTDASGETPATYATLPTPYPAARMHVDATEIAVAMVGLLGITDEEDYPTEPIPVHVRLRATLTNGMGEVISNTIVLPNVKGYFALDPVTLPETMYITGSMTVPEWDWTGSYSMVPVHSNDGKFWSVQYFAEGDEIKFNTSRAWDGGEFGYEEGRFPDSSISYAGLEDSGGNIKINNAGWYIVVVTTEIVGRDYNFTVEFLPPNVYLTGDAAGGWDTFEEANRFTVPDTGDGEFVSPAFVADAELRMCIVLEGIEWWKTEFVILDGKIEYRGKGDDQDRVNVTQGQRAYLNFLTGEGYVR